MKKVFYLMIKAQIFNIKDKCLKKMKTRIHQQLLLIFREISRLCK